MTPKQKERFMAMPEDRTLVPVIMVCQPPSSGLEVQAGLRFAATVAS